MAQLLAPYNNSMRLGQGFNSYTQQICLDQAVLPDNLQNRAALAKKIVYARAINLEKPATETSSPATQLLPAALKSEGTDDYDSEGVRFNSPSSLPANKKGGLEILPWVKPQIVTYSSRFVDKLSDVTDSMNISGSLSIKTATIGGKANGSYVDSDKFKSSDINFHLQVKVTNQIHDAQNYNIFNKIPGINEDQFPKIYGDTYISGWEEGGELNAIISMKVNDKSKIFEIKAGLEAEMTTPSISGAVSADFEMKKNNITRDTETTIAVNWSGGGSIKEPSEEWGISTLKKTAAAFPDLVAITPQRTYAILTKYTALESFHRQVTKFSPLDYENAGIYTGSMLDHYMDYKILWKQISHATYELEGNRAMIEMAQPSEDVYELAKVKKIPSGQINAKLLSDGKDLEQTKSLESSSALAISQMPQDPPSKYDISVSELTVFQPTFSGLIHARKVCRFEMAKIVNEVDLVAQDPKLSNDPRRDEFFLHPLVFKQLLPVVRSAPEHAVRGVKDPYATLLLGYSPPHDLRSSLPPVYKLNNGIEYHDERIITAVKQVAHKAHDYRLQGCAPFIRKPHSSAKAFNDLKWLNSTCRPTELSVWTAEDRILGLGMLYANGETRKFGNFEGRASHVLQLAHDGSEQIFEVEITTALDDVEGLIIVSLKFATTQLKILDTTVTQSKEPKVKDTEKASSPETTDGKGVAKDPKSAVDRTPENKTSAEKPSKSEEPEKVKGPASAQKLALKGFRTLTWTKPDNDMWTLRGFFGLEHEKAIVTLGVVWGKDHFVPVPKARISPPLCKAYLNLGKSLQEQIQAATKLNPGYLGKFLMGNSIATDSKVEGVQVFNPLSERIMTGSSPAIKFRTGIDTDWTIKYLAFAMVDAKLSGIKVTYHNGKELKHGFYTPETEVWRCEVKSELVIAKMTTGKASNDDPGHVTSLEFIRKTEAGDMPAWPLDFNTLRYLGEVETSSVKQASEVIEAAPRIGTNAQWSVRGFYGEYAKNVITRIGVIWGCG